MKCFVYGTLRRGDYNHSRFGDEKEHRPATTDGQLFHVAPHRNVYPVAKFDRPGTIYGEVVDFPEETGEWRAICAMERGAGYVLAEIVVTYEDSSQEQVVGWHYESEPGGPIITTGDWFNDPEREEDE